MILQRCKVIQTRTEDGHFEFPSMALGIEIWVMPATIEMRRYRRAGIQGEFSALTVVAKDQHVPIPVAILEFTSEFRVEGY